MKYLLKSALFLALTSLIGCSDRNHKDCYLALKAVAESTEHYQRLGGDNSLNALWWKNAMLEAAAWKAQACKQSK